MSMSRGQAWDLLTQYNKEPFHLRHAVTVEHVMGWYARELGYGDQAEYWSIVGLLHDLDFEMWPEEHCVKSQELMRQAGVEEAIVRATSQISLSVISFIRTLHLPIVDLGISLSYIFSAGHRTISSKKE